MARTIGRAGTHGGEATRVVKKLRPGLPGTQRWMQRFGDTLLCVRYRLDDTRERRLTTVELVVDIAPARPARDAVEVAVRIGYEEKALRQRIKDVGARWDGTARLWRLPRHAAKSLGVLDRVVQE